MTNEDNAQKKIRQLTVLENNSKAIVNNLYSIKNQILETDSAIEELNKKDKAYKIIGGLMVEQNAKDLKEELETKKVQLKNHEKKLLEQEATIKKQAKVLKDEITKE